MPNLDENDEIKFFIDSDFKNEEKFFAKAKEVTNKILKDKNLLIKALNCREFKKHEKFNSIDDFNILFDENENLKTEYKSLVDEKRNTYIVNGVPVCNKNIVIASSIAMLIGVEFALYENELLVKVFNAEEPQQADQDALKETRKIKNNIIGGATGGSDYGRLGDYTIKKLDPNASYISATKENLIKFSKITKIIQLIPEDLYENIQNIIKSRLSTMSIDILSTLAEEKADENFLLTVLASHPDSQRELFFSNKEEIINLINSFLLQQPKDIKIEINYLTKSLFEAVDTVNVSSLNYSFEHVGIINKAFNIFNEKINQQLNNDYALLEIIEQPETQKIKSGGFFSATITKTITTENKPILDVLYKIFGEDFMQEKIKELKKNKALDPLYDEKLNSEARTNRRQAIYNEPGKKI